MKLLKAILESCCDQGPLPPSTSVVRLGASCEVPLQAAVTAGVLGFGEHHGGTIESCANLLQEKIAIQSETNINKFADGIVNEYSLKNRRIPGFGHAYVEKDSRAVKLLQIARNTIYIPSTILNFSRLQENGLSGKRDVN